MKHVIFGNTAGEHLYAEISGSDIVLYSHELAVNKGLNQWRTRAGVAMPLEAWVKAGQVLSGEGPGQVGVREPRSGGPGPGSLVQLEAVGVPSA